MGSVKSEEACSIELNEGNSPFYPDKGFAVTMPLQEKSSPLNIAIKNDTSLSISALCSISQSHP